MTFHNAPCQPPSASFSRQWLILFLGLFLILLSMFMVSTLDQTPQLRPVVDSAIASRWMPKQKQDSQPILGRIDNRLSNTYLAASVKTTPLETSLLDLLKGSRLQARQTGQYSEIPKGTRLLGVSIQGNIVFVDLSEEFTSGGGSTSMIQRVEELERKIHQFNEKYKLKILINGKRLPYLGGEGLEME